MAAERGGDGMAVVAPSLSERALGSPAEHSDAGNGAMVKVKHITNNHPQPWLFRSLRHSSNL